MAQVRNILATVAALFALALAGCGSSDPEPNVGEITTSPQGEAQMKASGGKAKPTGNVPSVND